LPAPRPQFGAVTQQPLFAPPPVNLEGFEYHPGSVSVPDCGALLETIAAMPLEEAQYKQFTAKRRVMHFGGRYDFSTNELLPAGPLPRILEPLRERIARVAGIEPQQFTRAMIAEYRPGTQLGWHRDVPDFELVAGVSLGSRARIQFRPYPPENLARGQYVNAWVDPGSLYLLRGPARWEWQHRVPPVSRLRYSITFRTLRQIPAYHS
jgi:alkylated DNA repair dioxygenase AlkB